MENIERRVRREMRAMTRREVIVKVKVLDRQLIWLQAAQVLGVTPRHLRRIWRGCQRSGISAVMDQRVAWSGERFATHPLSRSQSF